MGLRISTALALAAFAAAGTPVLAPQKAVEDSTPAQRAVGKALDDFHDAASKADEERYFAHFASGGSFLGTDPSERWTVEEFQSYAHPYFSKGKGWTYSPRSRNVVVADDGAVAWFDEALDSEKWGRCRGTGSLRRIEGEWKIVQYSLSVPIPNGFLQKVVDLIKGLPSEKAR